MITQEKFIKYMKKHHPEKMEFEPELREVKDGRIYYWEHHRGEIHEYTEEWIYIPKELKPKKLI